MQNEQFEQSQQIKPVNRHWSQVQESGTLLGMKFLYWLYKLGGRGIFSIVIYPVALYFVIFRREQASASHQFLLTHFNVYPDFWKRKPNFFNVLYHFKSFAEVILDKLLGWLIDIEESDFALTSQELVTEILEDNRGQLIVGSHFGNLEFCRGFMQRYKSKVINILIYDKHAGNFVKMMQRESPDSRLNVFQVDEFDVQTIMLLKEKVDNGEWVFIAGDRIPLSGLQNTLQVTFFGKSAPLPIGPYMLAKALACPVKFMFAYRIERLHNKIIFDVVPVCDRLLISRKNRQKDLENYAQMFADKLQEHSLKAPYQWFNFYDFWNPEQTKSE